MAKRRTETRRLLAHYARRELEIFAGLCLAGLPGVAWRRSWRGVAWRGLAWPATRVNHAISVATRVIHVIKISKAPWPGGPVHYQPTYDSHPIIPNLRPIILAYFQPCPSSPTKSCREVQIAAEVVAVRNVEDPSVVAPVAEAPPVVPRLAAEVAEAVSHPENRAGMCPVWRYHLLHLFFVPHHTHTMLVSLQRVNPLTSIRASLTQPRTG